MNPRLCQICDRQALYLCGDCKSVAYCSNQHRLQHWRYHKQQCKVMMSYSQLTNEKEVKQKRFLFRKQYFDNFGHKIYDRALKIVQQLLLYEKQNILQTRFIQNQFQYGITVCLLCRTLIILGKKNQARIQIEEYLKEKRHFLQDMRDVCKFEASKGQTQPLTPKQQQQQPIKKTQSPSKTKPQQKIAPITPQSIQFLRKKLQLISAVANIYYSLNLSPLEFYTTYLEHIEFSFGPESLEASNCYFLIGTYYMEQKMYNRAIACFVRAADLRGPKAGDCYYNLAVIYQMRGKLDVAIKMYEVAIKLYEETLGQSSVDVAKIYQEIAQIMIKKNDWNCALKAFQKALKIYATKNQLEQFQTVKQKIKSLHQYMRQILQAKDKSLPKQIQDQLMEKKKTQINPNELKAEDASLQEAKRNKQRFVVDNLLRLSDNFLSKLNPLQIYRLSELQLQLQTCNSQFALAYIVANSQFMKRLGEKRLKEMKQENEKLFELMNLQRKSVSSIVEQRLFADVNKVQLK